MQNSSGLLRLLLPVFVLCACLAPASLVAAEAETTRALDIKEITLDNGLRIFVVERSFSPTFAAAYQFGVGGTSDPKGASGIAHLLEHMLFKGSHSVGTLDPEKEAGLMARLSELWAELNRELDRRENTFQEADEEKIAALEKEIEEVSAEHKKLIVKNEYDELMTRAGGVSMNATTNWDRTRYFLQLPSNQLEFWFQMESDRLLNPVFREFYSERDVVHEERRLRYENTASGQAYEAMQAILFNAHPYATPVIGWPRDIQRLMREDAEDYFTSYYSPSNCLMAFVGDVTAAEVERLAKQHFGEWKRQEFSIPVITAEPEQNGPRRSVVEFDARPQLRMAWRTVPEGHEDQFPLDLLSMILGGLASSRIDETIVQQERLATVAGTGHPTRKYGGYMTAYAVQAGDGELAELEQAIEREIARIQTDGVTAVELERAKVAVESSRVGSLKSNLGQAMRILNSVFVSGSTDYIEDYEARIHAVTAEQIQKVAAEYLTPKRKNVVEVLRVKGARSPEMGAGGRAGVAHKHGGAVGKRGARHSVGFDKAMSTIRAAKPIQLKLPEVGKDVQRVELKSGITVFIKEDHSAPSVEMSLSWLGGSNTTPVEQLAPFELASDLLDEGGTKSLSPIELQARKDELGMDFSIWIGGTRSGARFWSLSRNFDEAFDLALDVIMRPRFDAERLETLKGQYIDSMRRRDESPGRAASLLLGHVINKEHPRLSYVPSRAEIEAITPGQIREVWQRYLGRDNLYVTVVGDFSAAEMLELIGKKLGGWRKAKDSERKYIAHEPFLRPGVYLVDKEIPQPAVRIYHQIAVDRTASMEEHAALEILNDILGGSGFRSRLMERLRSDEGLTYGIRSSLSHQGRPGVPGRLRISYQTKKDSVVRSVDSVLEECRKIVSEEVSQAEVQEQVEAWRNRFVFRYTNDFYVVSRLAGSELDDRPYDYDSQELEYVQKVTVEDVQKAAKKYLAPDKLTVAVFGTLTEEDRKAFDERFTVKTLDASEVFPGGYDEKPAEEDEPEPAEAGKPAA